MEKDCIRERDQQWRQRFKFAAWSVTDSDIAGLPMVLSRDPVASSSGEPTANAASEPGETGEPCDETWETRGTSVLGDTGNTGTHQECHSPGQHLSRFSVLVTRLQTQHVWDD